jgi:uncharacterized membrane protein
VSSSRKADFLIPGGLLVLSFVPAVAGTFRVVQLTVGAEITPDNARFFAAPLPVVLHIVSSVIYSIAGAFQFSPGFRRRRPQWHRAAGRVLIPCGLIVAFSALWMNQSFPLGNLKGPGVADYDGRSLYAIRLVVGSAMAVFLCLGVATILKRDFRSHGAWMIRAYALGLGAGTQAFTHIPWFLFPSIHGELTRTLCMAAGWAINAAVAEWAIARAARPESRAPEVVATDHSTNPIVTILPRPIDRPHHGPAAAVGPAVVRQHA